MFKVHAQKLLLPVIVLIAGAITLPAQTASPLTASPTSVAITYQLPSTAGAAVTVHLTAASSTYFTVNASTVPFWLTLGAMNGTASTTAFSLTFTPSSLAGSLAAGSYNATVHVLVSGYNDLQIPVNLAVSNVAPTLSVAPTAITQNWAQGSAYPTYSLTLTSSGNPIDFTATPAATATTSGGITNWVKVNHSSGVAYSFGTPLSITFLQAAFDDANVGDTLSGSVAIAVSGTTVATVNITLTVTAPAPTITRIFPAEAQVEQSGGAGITVVVTGTGFYNNGTTTTSVSLNGGSALTSGVNIVNSSTLTVAIPASSLGTPGPLSIAVTNGGSPSSINLNVTNSPIVYSTTDSAGLVEAAPGTNPTVAPYEMITLFGVGFLNGDPGTLQASVDSFSRYPNVLADADSGYTGNLTVSFYKTDGVTLIANAYLLFASDTQINLFVPAGIVGNTTVKFSVTFGSNTSSLYAATVAASNPGIFTTTSTGQGQGAILNQDYSANSSSSKAAVGTTVMIYASGLGVPNSTAADTASTSGATYPAGCVSPANYMTAVNDGTFTTGNTHPSPVWTSLDGATILSTDLATNRFAPCMVNSGSSAVTVTIGGKTATVSYAGWVSGSVAGLYQINAVVPTGVTGTVPVVVTVGGTASSQTGVTMVTP